MKVSFSVYRTRCMRSDLSKTWFISTHRMSCVSPIPEIDTTSNGKAIVYLMNHVHQSKFFNWQLHKGKYCSLGDSLFLHSFHLMELWCLTWLDDEQARTHRSESRLVAKIFCSGKALNDVKYINKRSLFVSGKLSADDVEPSPSEDTMCFWATKILCTPDPKEKASPIHTNHHTKC